MIRLITRCLKRHMQIRIIIHERRVFKRDRLHGDVPRHLIRSDRHRENVHPI